MLIITEIDQLVSFNLFDISPYTNVVRWVKAFDDVKGYKENIGPVNAIAATMAPKKPVAYVHPVSQPARSVKLLIAS